MNLGGGQEFDVAARRVGAIGTGDVPAYTAVDLRYAWRVNRYFDLYFIAQKEVRASQEGGQHYNK